MTKLKPCPFCGGEAIIEQDEYWYLEWAVSCCNEDCVCYIGRSYRTKEETIAAWNRRDGE
jgi:Lar family restriction alleviation protein